MNETASAALQRYTFERGELRGTSLSLLPACLVHRSDNYLETLPLGGMTAVRVSFERHARKLGWGIALVAAALVMLAITGPLGTWASSGLVMGPQSVPVMNYVYRLLEALANLMPVAALACVIGGGALGAFGWLGSTTLLISLPGGERLYRVRGRDTLLLDFAEALSDRLMLLRG
jgi:hypothetical protein